MPPNKDRISYRGSEGDVDLEVVSDNAWERARSVLSDDPENGIEYLVLRTRTSVPEEHGDFGALREDDQVETLREKIESLQDEIDTLRDENERLRERRPDTEAAWDNIPRVQQDGTPFAVLEEMESRDQFLTSQDIYQFTPKATEKNRVHTLLYDLEDRGLVEKKESDDSDVKFVYKITGKGRDALTKSRWESTQSITED